MIYSGKRGLDMAPSFFSGRSFFDRSPEPARSAQVHQSPIFWNQSFPDPGPQRGLNESKIDRIPKSSPFFGSMYGEDIDGMVFYPRADFKTEEQAIRFCYLDNARREGQDDDRSFFRISDQCRYYRVEPAGRKWQVLVSRDPRQNERRRSRF